MKTLVIYDNTGNIYIQVRGAYELPQGGVQYLEIEIPPNKILMKIDTSVTPNIPVYEDVAPSELDALKIRIAEQESALIELASMLGGTK